MGNFYTDAIKKDARFASLQPIHDLALLEPVTQSKVLAIIADAAAAGIKLMAYETYRSRFGVDPEFVAADKIRDDSGCVLRYERTFMRPVLTAE